MAVLPSQPPPRTIPAAHWHGWWSGLALLAATLVALGGVAGLLATLGAPAPSPTPQVPERYHSGPPLADRLVIVFLPQLDEDGLARFRRALTPEAPAGSATAALFAVERPEYTSFGEVTVRLLAGNTSPAPAASSPLSPTQPPDNLVRIAQDQGRGALLFGPPEWRALFGPTQEPPSAPKPARATLAEAAGALPAADAALVAVYLKDVREVEGELRGAVAGFGAALGERDAVLLVGGGGLGVPLGATLSGPGVKGTRGRTVALNDVAPTCAVVIGSGYPAEARGRIAWALLAVDEGRKAVATAALARQRMALARRAVPPGVPAPALLGAATGRLPLIEALLREGQFAYSYQLSSSSVDEADRALLEVASAAPILTSRHAAWPLIVACLTVAGLAVVLALVGRAGNALAVAGLGAVLALGLWIVLVTALRRVAVPTVPGVAAVLLPPALLGGVLSAWLGRGRRRTGSLSLWRRGFTVELLVLLAALPAAVCAYRYGLPWQLRLEETAPLFRWRSALLAPSFLLCAGFGWLLVSPTLPTLWTRVQRYAVTAQPK